MEVPKEYKDKSYNFYEDPGHGWFEVHRQELINLGIEKQITQYSYKNKDLVYLEEDCDAPLFIKTWCKQYNMPEENFKSKINFIYRDQLAIRTFDYYK